MEQKLKKQLSVRKSKPQQEDIQRGREIPPPWMLEEKK